jgi:TetR/AcrR family transcriptional repressor of nem operon
MSSAPTPRQPEATRQKLLEAAFMEFYQKGFQGGSLSRIVESAGITKGALFHHFAGKQALGYAVLDDVIDPLLKQRWLGPVASAADPVAAMQDAFRTFIGQDIASGHWVFGCPLNNLAQEMSPLDEGFRTRIDALYQAWRGTFAAALAEGQRRGLVRPEVDVNAAAALVVFSQMGIWGTGKYSQNQGLMTQAGEALCAYLDTLKA